MVPCLLKYSHLMPCTSTQKVSTINRSDLLETQICILVEIEPMKSILSLLGNRTYVVSYVTCNSHANETGSAHWTK